MQASQGPRSLCKQRSARDTYKNSSTLNNTLENRDMLRVVQKLRVVFTNNVGDFSSRLLYFAKVTNNGHRIFLLFSTTQLVRL